MIFYYQKKKVKTKGMSQFTPIDIFRIDAKILSEKMDRIKKHVQLDEKFSRGMLYFYFSWAIEEVSQKDCFRKFKECF